MQNHPRKAAQIKEKTLDADNDRRSFVSSGFTFTHSHIQAFMH